MNSDRDHSGSASRRNPSAPVPGMPYRLRPDAGDESSAVRRRDFGFIESMPAPGRQDDAGDAYNPWEEQGWQGAETAFPTRQEPEVLQEERYFKPMLDLRRDLPDPYESYPAYEEEARLEPEFLDPEYPVGQTFDPPPPPPPKQARRFEPWRMAVILCCLAGLIYCAVEIYRIADGVVRSDAELSEYREIYLRENNEDFTRRAQAVALRPPGETYPPTASPAPVQTPTPTARIPVQDPLAGVLDGGIDPNQSVAPSGPTPAVRSALARYPLNPLLIPRDEIVALQAENPDIVGRLIIDGVVNEIVTQRDNTYYLNHNAMDVYSGYGAVFADERVSFRTPPENILLYGRTANEGKTFAPLKNYISQGIGFAGRYAFLSFNSLYEEARYVIVAVVQASGDPASPDYFDYQAFAFGTDEDMLAYAREAIGRSKYIFNVGVLPTDRLLTLVTLSDGADNESIVIVCRMLRDGERDGYIQAN